MTKTSEVYKIVNEEPIGLKKRGGSTKSKETLLI